MGRRLDFWIYCDGFRHDGMDRCPNTHYVKVWLDPFEGVPDSRSIWLDAYHRGWRVHDGRHFCAGCIRAGRVPDDWLGSRPVLDVTSSLL